MIAGHGPRGLLDAPTSAPCALRELSGIATGYPERSIRTPGTGCAAHPRAPSDAADRTSTRSRTSSSWNPLAAALLADFAALTTLRGPGARACFPRPDELLHFSLTGGERYGDYLVAGSPRAPPKDPDTLDRRPDAEPELPRAVDDNDAGYAPVRCWWQRALTTRAQASSSSIASASTRAAEWTTKRFSMLTAKPARSLRRGVALLIATPADHESYAGVSREHSLTGRAKDEEEKFPLRIFVFASLRPCACPVSIFRCRLRFTHVRRFFTTTCSVTRQPSRVALRPWPCGLRFARPSETSQSRRLMPARATLAPLRELPQIELSCANFLRDGVVVVGQGEAARRRPRWMDSRSAHPRALLLGDAARGCFFSAAGRPCVALRSLTILQRVEPIEERRHGHDRGGAGLGLEILNTKAYCSRTRSPAARATRKVARPIIIAAMASTAAGSPGWPAADVDSRPP